MYKEIKKLRIKVKEMHILNLHVALILLSFLLFLHHTIMLDTVFFTFIMWERDYEKAFGAHYDISNHLVITTQ